MPDISSVARHTAEKEGWTDETLLGVCLDFLETQKDKVKANFARYLHERSSQDEEEVREWLASDGFQEDMAGSLELIQKTQKDEGCSLMDAILKVARGES